MDLRILGHNSEITSNHTQNLMRVLLDADQRSSDEMNKAIVAFEKHKEGMALVQRELTQKTAQLTEQLAISERQYRELKTVDEAKINSLQEKNQVLEEELKSTQDLLKQSDSKLNAALLKIHHMKKYIQDSLAQQLRSHTIIDFWRFYEDARDSEVFDHFI